MGKFTKFIQSLYLKRISTLLKAKKTVIALLFLVIFLGGGVSVWAKGIGGRPANPVGYTYSRFFMFNLDPGQTHHDEVLVMNSTNQDWNVRVYGADWIPSSGDGYALKQRTETMTGMGDWISLDQNEVFIPANDHVTIPFTLTLPSDAADAELCGGIMMEKIDPNNTSEGIALYTRSGVRVYNDFVDSTCSTPVCHDPLGIKVDLHVSNHELGSHLVHGDVVGFCADVTTICHDPLVNNETMAVHNSELSIHLGHGDVEGTCEDTTTQICHDPLGAKETKYVLNEDLVDYLASGDIEGDCADVTTICHDPLVSNETIAVHNSELATHLDHGDVEGNCADTTTQICHDPWEANETMFIFKTDLTTHLNHGDMEAACSEVSLLCHDPLGAREEIAILTTDLQTYLDQGDLEGSCPPVSTICHNPSENWETKVIFSSELNAYLAQGDLEGNCTDIIAVCKSITGDAMFEEIKRHQLPEYIDQGYREGDDCVPIEVSPLISPPLITIKARPEKRVKPWPNWDTRGKVRFYAPGSNIPKYTFDAFTGEDGIVILKEKVLMADTYDVSYTGLSHLQKYIRGVEYIPNIELTDHNDLYLDFTNGESYYLLAGDTDITRDNYINSLDLSVTATTLYENNDVTDLNDDTMVNSLDISIQVHNLYKNGEER